MASPTVSQVPPHPQTRLGSRAEPGEAASSLKRPSHSEPARQASGLWSPGVGKVLSFLLGLGQQLEPAQLLPLAVGANGLVAILQRHLRALPSDV